MIFLRSCKFFNETFTFLFTCINYRARESSPWWFSFEVKKQINLSKIWHQQKTSHFTMFSTSTYVPYSNCIWCIPREFEKNSVIRRLLYEYYIALAHQNQSASMCVATVRCTISVLWAEITMSTNVHFKWEPSNTLSIQQFGDSIHSVCLHICERFKSSCEQDLI